MSSGNTFVPIEFVQLFHHILGLLVRESLVDKNFMAADFWAKWRKKFVNTGQKRKAKDGGPGPAAKGARGRSVASTEDEQSFVGVESTTERVNTELVTQPLRPPTLLQEIRAANEMTLKDKKKLLTTRTRRTPPGKILKIRCLNILTIKKTL